GLGIADLGKTVFEVNQAGYVQTLGNAGHVLAGTSQNQTGLDFANFKLFDISGTKFLDANVDGTTANDVRLRCFTILAAEDNSGDLSAGDPSPVSSPTRRCSDLGLGIADLGKTVFEVNQAGYVQTLGNAGHVLAGTSQNQTGLDFANFKLFNISGT